MKCEYMWDFCLIRWKETTNIITKLHDMLEGVRGKNNKTDTIEPRRWSGELRLYSDF